MTRFACCFAVISACVLIASSGAALALSRFSSPENAVDALVAAVRSGDASSIGRVLGPGSKKLISSGDPVADKTDRDRFVAAYDENHKIEPKGNEATLFVGTDEWPFPIPLRQEENGWRFDAAAGARQIIDRRIGRNELAAIATCRAIVDAEREYASEPRSDGAISEYAQRFVSSRGKRDGLYWPVEAGEPPSPLGPLVAEARAEGYGGRHTPYHGYFFRTLKGQGSSARGGARDYVVRGHMIGGFAVVAYPAKWGDSGMMTFVVNQDGDVYERNFGRDTKRAAGRMTLFDPDSSWTLVPDGK